MSSKEIIEKPTTDPQTLEERVDMLEYYLSKVVKALKIEDTSLDSKWRVK